MNTPSLKPIPKFTAVIHIETMVQVLDQTALALTHGAQGVFLIDHHAISHWNLSAVYREVRREHPLAWIGLNFLDLDPTTAIFHRPKDADGLWVDNGSTLDTSNLGTRAWRLFSGTAFKYQPTTGTDAEMARQSIPRIGVNDVITTSGPGTGQAATMDKVANMRDAIGLSYLALASGVTPDNVASFAPFIDSFLVATGISHDFHHLDPARVRALADALGLP